MYPTSAEYKTAILKSNREFETSIIIEHALGTLHLSNFDLSLGGVTYTDSTQSGSDFTIGGVVASTISFAMFNKPEYDTIDFTGAIIRPSVGLKLPDDTFEYIPLGVFIVDEDKRERDVISFKAMDNMIRLGDSYSESTLAYPTSLLQIYEDICSHNGITPATVDFPNKDYTVTEKPEGEYTFRDILGYVAELSGTFSKFNRSGQLELSWYKDSMLSFTPHNRYNFKASDEVVKITGIMYVEDGEGDLPDTVYITGTDEYAINLTDNPLLQGGYQTVLPNILANVSGVEFRPFESEWQGDPNIRSGYKVVHETVDGKFVNTIITKSTFNYGRKSKFMGEGTSKVKRNFNGTTSKKLNEIVRRLIKNNDITKELSDIELARLNAMELMANTLGGYLIVDDEDGSIYISSTPELQEFGEYWKWGLGGFAHYKDGVIDTSITADGSIVSNLLSTGIITADMIKIGAGTQFEEGYDPSNAVQQDTLYNHVNITQGSGIQVFDNLNNERVRLGNYASGKYGLQLKDKTGNVTVLDEDGLLDAYQINTTDNLDATHPLVMRVYVPEGVSRVDRMDLVAYADRFRAYQTGAHEAGAAVMIMNSGVSDIQFASVNEQKSVWFQDIPAINPLYGWAGTRVTLQLESGFPGSQIPLTSVTLGIQAGAGSSGGTRLVTWGKFMDSGDYIFVPATGAVTFQLQLGQPFPANPVFGDGTQDINPSDGGMIIAFLNNGPSMSNAKLKVQLSATIDTTHTHIPIYNIYEDIVPASIGIKIDGVNRTTALGGPWSGSGEAFGLPSLNLAPYIQTSGWHTIEFTSTTLGRITAALTCQQFIRYSGSV